MLGEHEIRSQQDLIDLLANKGIATTQPMLSRDLRGLGVAKREGRYQILESDRITPLEKLSLLLRSAHQVPPNLVVLHCEPGAAHAIARALEGEELPEVRGTIAGDDTVFVAVNSKAAGQRVRRHVQALLHRA